MLEEIQLLQKKDMEEAFKPTEGISNVDVELGTLSKFRFKLGAVGQAKNVPIVTFLDKEFPMTTKAVAEAARLVGIPVNYANKCPSDMLNPHLEHWWGPGGSGRARFYIQNGSIVGCSPNVTSKYHSNAEILTIVEEAIGSDKIGILGYNPPSVSLDQSVFSVVTDQCFEAKTGDMLYGGIEIQNSVTGDTAIEIAPFIFRQVCSNGMIVSEGLGRWSRREEDSNFSSWAYSASKSATQRIGGEFHRIKKLTEVPVGQRADNTLRSLFQKFGISNRTQVEIVEESQATNEGNGPENMYDIWNAITRVATHSSKLSTTASRDLRWVAGEVVREVSLCPHCSQLISEE